jgi:hypothetical protein
MLPSAFGRQIRLLEEELARGATLGSVNASRRADTRWSATPA